MRYPVPGYLPGAPGQSRLHLVWAGELGGWINVNAVNACCCLRAHIAENHITSYPCWVPLAGVSPPAAATADQLDARTGLEADTVALEHELPLAVGISLDIGAVGARCLPPVQPPGQACVP